MPVIDITNPAIIKFLIENYEKEGRLRLNWINKYKDLFHKAASIQEPKNYFENDVFAHNMAEGMAAMTRDHKTAGYNRRKVPIRDATFIPGVKHMRLGHSIEEVGLGTVKDDPRLKKLDTDLTPSPVMRPIDPNLKKLVYAASPHRSVYLDKRANIWPEKRYYFAECVNWDYGWRMKDSKAYTRPTYGRYSHMVRSLQTRVGPQSDPPYYKPADIPGVSKCSK